MNLDPLSFTLSQISYFVTNLTKKNYKVHQQEISSLIEKQGFEAERHLYRCLFSSIDFTTDNKTTGKDYHQTQYLKECFVSLLTKPHFISTINFSIDNPLQFQEQSKSSNNILSNISKTLKLNKIQEIVLAVALQQSNKEEIKKRSQEYLKQKLIDLVNPPFSENLNFSEVPIEIFQLILIEIETQLKPNSTNLIEFYNKLKKDLPKDKTSLILTPYIYSQQQEEEEEAFTDIINKKSIMDNSLADMIQEFGYIFTSNHDECRRLLLYINPSVKDLLTPLTVAKILSMMAKTHNSLNIDQQILINPNSLELINEAMASGLTWNVDVFVSVLNELTPNLSWKEVVKEFENTDLFLKDKVGLRIIIQALKKGLKEPFPIEYLYRIWKNPESQLSWIMQALKHSDVFSITDYQYRKTVTECLKVQPEEDNKTISSWRSLNLIEILLAISDNGFYIQCVEIFKTPVTLCPDLLLLGLLQLPNIMNKLKQELIATLIPIFLGNHPNSAVILQNAWSQNLHSNSIRNIIMSSLADWYMKASDVDQNSRLARILDVSQDLKALFVLLNGNPMIFNIDLACLAARRGYLKLDKWMSDRIRDHGELFIATVINFLRKRVPQLNNKEDQFSNNNMAARSIQAPMLPETIQTILKCISTPPMTISTELQQELYQINLEARALIEKLLLAQKSSQQNIGTQNFELLQSMIGNMNMGMNSANTNSNFNSPSKIFPPTSLGVNQNPLQAVNMNAGGYGNQNMLLHNPNTMDANKALNSLLTNNNGQQQQINRFNTYGQNINMRQGSIQGGDNVDQQNNYQQQQQQQQQTFSIEDEVEKCIMRLFKSPSINAPSSHSDRLGVEDFTEILARFKDSPEKKEKEFYTHALKYLIDGNTSLYSLDETQFTTMVNLWGVLIQKGVLASYFLGNCLKLLFQMLYKPTVSREFKFSVMVLERCKNRVKDYSDFCQHVSQGPNYSEVPKSLKEFIEYGRNTNAMQMATNPMATLQQQPLRSLTPPGNNNLGGYSTAAQQQQLQRNLSNNPSLAKPPQMMTSPQPILSNTPPNAAAHSRSVGGKPSIANATNIDTLLVANENDITAKPVPPSESIQDKIGFIFNNLSLSNMQAKSDDLKEIVKEEFWDWIAHYLVVKRVSIEPNFHVLYSQFIDTLKKDILNHGVLSETFRNIKVLLRSDKNDQKFCDRALLKNLGSWLGLITLAKNKPVLHKDIDLKCLIVEAFQKGQSELLFVVPFVAKVLEPAAKSRIFQPPNPWLMAILSVLIELHNEPDLKLNHKFEIEVLCKNLSIQMLDIGCKNILRNHEISEEQLTKRKEPGSATSSSQMSSVGVNSSNNAILSGPPQVVQNTPPLQQHQQQQQQQPAVQQQQQQDGQQQQVEANSNLLLQQVQPNNAAAAAAAAAAAYPQPKFKLTDIKTQSIQSNNNIIIISSEIQLFNSQPTLKGIVLPVLEKAVGEIQQVLLEKAVRISISAAELLIKKDFALEPDDGKMLKAARSMIANMSSGMMLITAKEPLTTHLKTVLSKHLSQPLDIGVANAFAETINDATTRIVDDNIEVCMCFLQKCAIQKSIIELEKRLSIELELRQRAHSENRAYFDAAILNYQNEKMPENIRLKVASIGPQFSVYEEFGRNIPGFKTHEEKPSPSLPTPPVQPPPVDDINPAYEAMIGFIEAELATLPSNHSLTASLQNLLVSIQEFKATSTSTSAFSLVKKLFYNILETCASHNDMTGATNEIVSKCRDKYFQVVKLIITDQRFTAGGWLAKETAKIWIECANELKYSVESVAILFKLKLLNFQTVDQFIAPYVEAGSPKFIHIATQLIKFFYIEHASMFSDIEFSLIIEAVTKTASNLRHIYQNSDLRDIMEVIRMNYDVNFTDRVCATALSMMYTGVTQARDFDDPSQLKEKSQQLLEEWIQHHAPVPIKENTKAFQQFVLQMNSQGLFKTDDMITRFFRICTELCVASCNNNLNQSKTQRTNCYTSLDAFVKLIILLVKHSGDHTNHINKINLFNKVLGLIGGCLLYDHEVKGTQFEPMPFHRLLHMLLYEATLPENNLEVIMPNVLQAFVNVYHIIRPSKAPGFAYAWLELVSHRIFLPKMLNVPLPSPDQNYKSWTMYAILLTQLIRFLAPFLKNLQLNEPIQQLYRGTLRLFLVLLHDFPEFLCGCHYQFCDVIPSNCIQLRNLVLSAFPRSMKLPDPLTPNLKVEMIGETDTPAPRIAFPYTNNIPLKLKSALDSYIRMRQPVAFLGDLRSYLVVSPDPGCHYNIQLMNALVMYVGALGINALKGKNLIPSLATLTDSSHSPHSDIFQSLAADLDSEGRYLFITAVANHLRYPNSHTHYFGCALLNLFSEANSDLIKEQITRVLCERLTVNRPHPWGLLVTFIELIRNPVFKFWQHQFVYCTPDIETIFKQLGNSRPNVKA